MLIYFFSDRNYVLQGFYARYNISDCPYNCSGNGACSRATHTCICFSGYAGNGCEQALCPSSCINYGSCNMDTLSCDCDPGRIGYDCGLVVEQPAVAQSGWHEVDPFGTRINHADWDVAARTGHSGAFVGGRLNRMYIFGGTTLNMLLNDLRYFNFVDDLWHRVVPARAVAKWPSARHSHDMVSLADCLYLFGGIQQDGSHSNELWRFNITSVSWTLLSPSGDIVQPAGVASHTLTIVDDRWIYLFGGRTADGTFLSDMYRWPVNVTTPSWEKLRTHGGKESNHRLVGHSSVFHQESRSLVIFGGFLPDNARFPKRTSSLQMFNIDADWWSEINYDTTSAMAPKERAFHCAAILGNYMVIHGGNIHVHHEDETCYDSQIYFYHLGCHTWVDGLAMSKSLDG